MPSPRLAAQVFCPLLTVVCLFQLSLALGAPWGAYAMGGAFPGGFPEPMRIAALVQIGVLALAGLVVLSRAGVLLPRWARTSRWLSWVIVGLVGLGVILNLITPSPVERMIWAPVAGLLFFAGLRVASSR
jgi:hypothetical protein